MKYKRTLYLDMDGVIVDFDKEFLTRFNMTVEQKEALTSDEFWKIFNSNSTGFFKSAPPFNNLAEHISKLFSQSEIYDFNIEILTALPKLSHYPTAKQEKREWLKVNRLDNIPFNIGPFADDKQKHCHKGDILIDDNILNIIQWNAVGGIGILHTDFKQTHKHLNVLLEYEAMKHD